MAQKVYIFNYLFFVFCIFITNTVLSKTIIGIGLAIDGDTIHIGESKIRLHAIDAPEIKQTCKIGNEIWNCGHQSARKLKNLIKKNEIKCEVKDIDRYKRYVAECYLNNLNINQYMVRHGWAIAYRYYSTKFVEDEKIAKKNKLGIWQGVFMEPYLFRKNN